MSLSEEIIIDLKEKGVKITEDIFNLSLEKLIELHNTIIEND